MNPFASKAAPAKAPCGSRRAAMAGLAFAICLLMGGLFGGARAEAAISGCSVSSSGIIFSPYDTVSKASVDGAGTITVSCTGSGSNSLSLNLSGGNSGSCTARRMTKGSATLSYQIYSGSTRTSIWCDGGNRLDIDMDFVSGNSLTRTFTMYGRIASGQNPTFGSYSDMISVALKKGGGTIASTTASISGSVSPICSVTAGSLGFGIYSAASPTAATAHITVNCSNGGAYTVSLGRGENSAGGLRRMIGPGGSYLSYEIFSNAARTVQWGDGAILGTPVSGTGSGSAQHLTVYGRIPSSQLSTPGTYSDSVVVTVEY